MKWPSFAIDVFAIFAVAGKGQDFCDARIEAETFGNVVEEVVAGDCRRQVRWPSLAARAYPDHSQASELKPLHPQRHIADARETSMQAQVVAMLRQMTPVVGLLLG